MSLFLRRDTLPELAGLERADKRRVWQKAYLHAFKEPFSWIGIMNFIVLGMLGKSIFGPPGLVVGGVLGAMVWMQFHIRAAKPWCAHVREEMGLGVPPSENQEA